MVKWDVRIVRLLHCFGKPKYIVKWIDKYSENPYDAFTLRKYYFL